MKKSLLFPYCYQKTGWHLLLLWLTWIAINFILRILHVSVPEYPLWIYDVLLVIYSFLPTVATLMICLSKEKNEDEYIGYIRARSVFFMVIIFFSTLLINVSLTNVGLHICGWSPHGYLMFSWLYTNPFIITIFYIIIFKGSLLVNWLKTRNDGQ